MTMGIEGKNGVRNHDLKECQEIIDVFVNHGHTELDTARMYAEGTTEPVCLIFDLNITCLSRCVTASRTIELTQLHVGHEVI